MAERHDHHHGPWPGEGPGVDTGHYPREEYRPGERWNGADLKTLFKRLNQDATQLAHDEIELAKLELREVASAFAADVQEASRTLVQNMAKVGAALVMAALAGLALTAGAILGLGLLLGAYWAGGLIVGAILLVAAVVLAVSAARDLKHSPELRLEHGRQTLAENTSVLKEEARDTKEFAKEEAEAFKRHATPPEEPRRHEPRHHA
jgi:hypothetical protein